MFLPVPFAPAQPGVPPQAVRPGCTYQGPTYFVGHVLTGTVRPGRPYQDPTYLVGYALIGTSRVTLPLAHEVQASSREHLSAAKGARPIWRSDYRLATATGSNPGTGFEPFGCKGEFKADGSPVDDPPQSPDDPREPYAPLPGNHQVITGFPCSFKRSRFRTFRRARAWPPTLCPP